MKKGIEKAVAAAVEEIGRIARPVETKEAIAQVATLSSSDEKIGESISEAMEKVGKDGVITVEDSNVAGINLKIVEGMNFNRGYISPYMVTNTEKMEAELDNPYILITDKKISAIGEIIPVLEKVVAQHRPLLVIAEDIDGEALATLVVNKIRGSFTCVGVKAPGFGERRKAMLEDIAIMTDGLVVSADTGAKLENVGLEVLGQAKKVFVRKEETVIVDGAAPEQALRDRIANIRQQLETTESEYDKEKFQERMAKLAGGIAILQVGAATETELKEKKYRVEDALAATQAAVEEGIVAGGGSTLIHIIPAVEKVAAEGDELTGVNLVKKSLEEPLRQIANNAGVEGSVVVEKVKELPEGEGFNALTNSYENMVDAGIIDPAKVTRSAIQNAASIAAMLLTTETIVCEKKQPAAALAAANAANALSMADMM